MPLYEIGDASEFIENAYEDKYENLEYELVLKWIA